MPQFAAGDRGPGSMIDTTATPPWCMVPAAGRKVVRLAPDDGLTLRVAPGATTNLMFEFLASNPSEVGIFIRKKEALQMAQKTPK